MFVKIKEQAVIDLLIINSLAVITNYIHDTNTEVLQFIHMCIVLKAGFMRGKNNVLG